jgi:predicted nuclease of predicted toxin-antitoxin system
VKILIDMNLSHRYAALLNERGFIAAHWSDIGIVNAPDTEIMAYARENDCVVLTNDLDFSAILRTSAEHKPSVIQIRGKDVRPETIIDRLVNALTQMSEALANGALLTIDANKTRIRILPFH